MIGASPYLIHVRAAWNFEPGAIAIAVLADWFRRATEQVATAAGPAIGGLLDVSFDSIAELVLALFVLADGKVELTEAPFVKQQLIASLLPIRYRCRSASDQSH